VFEELSIITHNFIMFMFFVYLVIMRIFNIIIFLLKGFIFMFIVQIFCFYFILEPNLILWLVVLLFSFIGLLIITFSIIINSISCIITFFITFI
jgi:hypothetical protein